MLVLLMIVVLIVVTGVYIYRNVMNVVPASFNTCMSNYNNKCVCFNHYMMDLYLEYIKNPESMDIKLRANPRIVSRALSKNNDGNTVNVNDKREMARNIRQILKECHPDKNVSVSDEGIKSFTAFITTIINDYRSRV